MGQWDYWETCWGQGTSEQEDVEETEPAGPKRSYRVWAKYVGFTMAIITPLAIGIALWKIDPLSLPQPEMTTRMLVERRIANAGIPAIPDSATDVQVRTEAFTTDRAYCIIFKASKKQREEYLAKIDVVRSYKVHTSQGNPLLQQWLPVEASDDVQGFIVPPNSKATMIRVYHNLTQQQIVVMWLDNNSGSSSATPLHSDFARANGSRLPA